MSSLILIHKVVTVIIDINNEELAVIHPPRMTANSSLLITMRKDRASNGELLPQKRGQMTGQKLGQHSWHGTASKKRLAGRRHANVFTSTTMYNVQ